MQARASEQRIGTTLRRSGAIATAAPAPHTPTASPHVLGSNFRQIHADGEQRVFLHEACSSYKASFRSSLARQSPSSRRAVACSRRLRPGSPRSHFRRRYGGNGIQRLPEQMLFSPARGPVAKVPLASRDLPSEIGLRVLPQSSCSRARAQLPKVASTSRQLPPAPPRRASAYRSHGKP